MIYHLISVHLSNTTPEVKYCFIKLVQQFGIDKPIKPFGDEVIKNEQQVLSGVVIKPEGIDIQKKTDVSLFQEMEVTNQVIDKPDHHADNKSLTGVKKLAFELGVSDAVLKQTFDYLKLAGFINQESIATHRGRHPSAYLWVSSRMLQLMEQYLYPYDKTRHRPLIEDLLKPDLGGRGGANKPRHPLKLANRLLLVVLLSKADDCGVVRNMGMAELCKLTCMSRDRLESQLTKLKKEGYIRSHIAGLTGTTLFGCAKGVLFLNLRHENYKAAAYSGLTLFFKEDNLYDEFELQEAKQIFRNAKNFLNDSNCPIGPLKIMIRRDSNKAAANCSFHDFEFFKESRFGKESVYLQVKLEEYASYFLNHRWRDIKKTADFIDDEVMNKIRQEVLAPKLIEKSKDGDFQTVERYERLFQFIHEISLLIAVSIKSRIGFITNLNLYQLRLNVLPNVISSQAYAVEVFYKQRKGAINFRVPIQKLESAMTIEDRCLYGLLTPVAEDNVGWMEKLNKGK